ncbi:MAG TPA: hypothetical protein VJS92_05935 [Candidatus Polarisedimenticolaceae bacterium]|nr:hypothetical protein [Candidatus Polarisedimenticolaceae bacterium]
MIRAALTGATLAALLAAEPSRPDRIPGLEAWYQAESLRGQLNNGEAVTAWKDVSGHGHDLTDAKTGLPAVFLETQLHGLPAVSGRARSALIVAAPFDLGEHTIFLVARAARSSRALFRHDTDEYRGVLLRGAEEADWVQNGGNKPAQLRRYGTAATASTGWGLTILGRQGSHLHAFRGLADVSAATEQAETLRVGRLLQLRHTAVAFSDGDGLSIAELLVFTRYLDEAERTSVAEYLAGRYGLDLGVAPSPRSPAPVVAPAPPPPGQAQLSSKSAADLNGAGVAVVWDRVDLLDEPFRHDPTQENTRLSCGRDGTRVRLFVSLPLSSGTADAALRVLFRVNGSTFLRGATHSGPLHGAKPPFRLSVQAEVLTTLNAGDYVEVVTIGEGAPGAVTLEPDAAVFIAEQR